MFNYTSKDNKHSHIAYLREDGTGITSVDNGHFHDVVEGMTLVVDGHNHDILDEIGSKKKRKASEKDSDKVSDCIRLWREAASIEKQYIEDGEEAEKFYKGEQWDDDDVQSLDADDRAALSMNFIQAKMDFLSGYQRRNRQDVKLLPTGEEDSRVADMLTALIKNIMTQNNYEHEETLVFDDQTITGRGNFNVDMDFNDNVEGDIVIERFPWGNVKYGPHEKHDLSDCEYIVKERWYSVARCKQEWPDKAKDIGSRFDTLSALLKTTKTTTDYPGQNYVKDVEKEPVSLTFLGETIDIERKNILVLEVWRKEYERATVLVNQSENVYENISEWDSKDRAQANTMPGFSTVKKKTHSMRVTTVATDILLEDEYPDLATDDFHLTPVYAYRRSGSTWGKIKAAIDPQKEINKRTSQMVDILNRVAPYGWMYDAQTFVDALEEKNFKESASRPGFFAKVNDINSPPKLQEGIKFPSELANFAAQAQDNLSKIMNVTNDLQGVDSNAQSGTAIAYRQRQGLIGNEFLFDNLGLAKRRLVKLIIANIQKYYTPERIYRILSAASKREKLTLDVNGQETPFEELDPQVVITLLTESDLTKYDVIISESAYSPSARYANFTLLLDAASKGIMIPPDVLIDLSDLPNKDKIKARMESMQAEQMQMENKKMDTEVQKAMIAAQSKQAERGFPSGGPA